MPWGNKSQNNNHTAKGSLNKRYSRLTQTLFVILSFFICELFVINNAYSGVGGFNEWRIKTGHVMSRGLILTEDGKPTYSEYLTDGTLGTDIAILDDTLKGSSIISGDSYRAIANLYTNFFNENADGIARGAEILTAQAYSTKTFSTIDGKSVSNKAPLLSSRIKTVLVKNSSQMLITSAEPSLLQSTINLNNIDTSVTSNQNIKSVLLDAQGNVIHASQNNIGLKSAFYTSDANTQVPQEGDTIYAPVSSVGIEMPPGFIGGKTATNSEGRFVVNYMLPPCPGFQFEYTTPITALLNFSIFNPKGQVNSVSYPLTQPGYDFCSGISVALANAPTLSGQMARINIMSIEANMSYPVVDYGFRVDTAVLSGKSYLTNGTNSLPISETQYHFETPSLTKHAFQGFDFDGDGTNDTAVQGNSTIEQDENGNDISVFIMDVDGALQGIYLSSGSNNPNSEDPELKEPDFVRLSDKLTDFNHQGLLESISKDDLQNTDILVFRESNGQLITSRKGLDITPSKGVNLVGVSEDDDNIYFSMMIRGPSAGAFDVFSTGFYSSYGLSGGESFSAMQSNVNMNPALHARKADHIRPHEKIKVVAINRKTGYIGTTRTNYGSYAADSATGEGVVNMTVAFAMKPPNLKVIAEREYIVDKGLTKGEDKKYLIGYEGAALASDKIIKITTEWLDHDGSPLPEGLADYGYTGRLAKIVDINILGQDSSALANFSITPGRHTQQVQIGSTATQNEHYYVQVNAEPINGNPTFDTLNAGNGPLESRPNNYVPVLTPIMDETLTWEQYLAYKKYKQDYPEATIDKPEPIYRWAYRPELQFSLYSLEVNNILTQSEESNSQQVDIYANDTPVISSDSDMVSMLYNLFEQEISPLQFLGAGQELVLALGEEEVALTIGSNQQVTFNNLEHLSSLDVEDFLSMRLYSNNDAGNILWEYAFSQLTIFPQQNLTIDNDLNTIEISADDAVSPQTVNVFVSSRKSDNVEIFQWSVDGSGVVSPLTTTSSNGSSTTSLKLPTVVDETSTVKAKIKGSNNTAYSLTYKITPGVAANINIMSKTGKTAIGGLGEIEWNLKVTDAFGNKVADGTKLTVLSPELDVIDYVITSNGEAKVVFKGSSDSGSIPVEIRAEKAEYTDTVTVHDVSLEYTNLTDIPANTKTPLGIKAESSYGDLSGLEIDVAVHRGSLTESRVVFNSEGLASVQYDSGKYRGFAQLSTKIVGTHKIISESFNVIDSDDYWVNNVLITGGNTSIDFGNGAVVEYSDTTDLNIKTAPLENVSLSLANIFEPPLYALQDYSTDLGAGVAGVVIDYSSGIDASSLNVTLSGASHKKYTRSWQFDKVAGEESFITVPEHVITSSLSQAGINFWLKIPDISTLASDSIIMNWDDFGLKLQLNADRTLSLIMLQDGGSQTISHPISIQSDQWYQVAAHFLNNELKLGINDQIVKAVASSPIKAEQVEDYALKIGLSDSQLESLKVTGVKVYDWDGEAKITFGNGDFEYLTNSDVNGDALVPVTAKPSLLAYTRAYETKTLLAQLNHSFLPSAYADAASDQCQSTYKPIDPTIDDANIKIADQFMSMLLECFAKPKVEEARVNYETSSGFKEATITLIKRESLEAIYAVLKQAKQRSIVFVNCLDAALTGSNSSAVGAGCDFVTSVLAVGDIRDLLIQSWHYHLGGLTGTKDDYDELTAQLAGVGLIASGTQLIPIAGQTGGVVITSFTAVAKIVAKSLKKVGAAGKTAGRLLAKKVGIIMGNPNTSIATKADKIGFMLPLVEVGASLALIYDTEPELFSFLVTTLSSGNNVDNMITWTHRYIGRLDDELTAQHTINSSRFIGILLPNAYALSNSAKAKFVTQFKSVTEHFKDLDVDITTEPGMEKAASHFNHAVELFLDDVPGLTAKLGNKFDDLNILRSFITVYDVGGAESVKHIKTLKGLNQKNFGLGANFDTEKYVEAIGLLPITKITSTMTAAEKSAFTSELKKLYKKMGSETFNIAKGAGNQMLAIINRGLASNASELTVAVEKRVEIPNVHTGEKPHVREFDEIIKIGDLLIKLEQKSWDPAQLDHYLKNAFSFKVTKEGNKDEVGQLLRDIVDYKNNGETFLIRWDFSPEMKETYTADQIADKVVKLITKDDVVQSNLKHVLGFDANDVDEFKDFIGDLGDNIKSDLFKVEDYQNIKQALNIN